MENEETRIFTHETGVKVQQCFEIFKLNGAVWE